MTQTMPDRQALTQIIRTSLPRATTYHASPARMRADETLVLDSRTGQPYRFGPVVELGHLQEPPTGNPPPLFTSPPAPPRRESLADYLMDEETVPVPPPAYDRSVDKPFLRRGNRRVERDPRWTWALVGAGMTVLFSAAGIGVSALLGVQW